MKINKISNLLILTSAVFALSACQGNKEKTEIYSEDCSLAFSATAQNNVGIVHNGQTNSVCKFLPLEIDETTKCEISGSNKVENLINFYSQNPEGKTFFKAPIEYFESLGDNIDLKDKLDYYFMIKKVKNRVDSNLFDSIKDYKYKGMSCVTKDSKFVSWVSEDDIIIVYENKDLTKTVVPTKKPVKKHHAKKDHKKS